MKRLAYVLFTIAVLSALSLTAIAQNEIGVAAYPNSTEMPEATNRLMEMRAPTWIAAGAYRTDDSIKDVVKYFREQAAKAKTPANPNEFVERLLHDNWKITDGTFRGANVVFGVNKDLQGITKEKTKGSFGTILLDDSFVRVHIMTPYPTPPSGTTVEQGTMIVLIRERFPKATDISSASTAPQEQVYTGREVTRKVRLRSKPEPNYVGIRGKVVLKAVFAASGKVENIVVVQGVPGLTEEAIKAARKITFDPAIKDGHYVSMWLQLEYNFY